jgi:hypothetical protein
MPQSWTLHKVATHLQREATELDDFARGAKSRGDMAWLEMFANRADGFRRAAKVLLEYRGDDAV